jgi:hypothetical protein
MNEREPFDHRGWVLLVFLFSVVDGVIAGLYKVNWELGAAITGSNYIGGLLTIIASKDWGTD